MLTLQDVRLDAKISTREEAIRAVGEILLQSDSIEPEYIDSMLSRENTATTYLGNGLAIPHGRPQDAGRIKQTRVAVLQIPTGVRWKDGKIAHLVFGIAAKSDEHIGLLRQLTGIVGDAELADRLAYTDNAQDILDAVAQSSDGTSAGSAVESDFDGSELEIVFSNPRGFHLRPAGKFVRAVQAYPGKVTLVVDKQEIEADSPSRILGLGISSGDKIRVRVRGDNETDTLSSLAALLEEINNEPQEEEANAGAAPAQWQSEQDANAGISGIMASPGLALARLWRWETEDLSRRQHVVGDTDAEIAALSGALSTARKQLMALAEGDLNPVQRGLFEAHASLVEDDQFRREAEAFIRSGDDALTAWSAVIETRAGSVEKMDDANLAQRAADIRDIGQRV